MNYERRDADGDAPATRHQPPVTSDASRLTRDASRAFEWAERVKGRAMLDAINRYDQRMKHAIAGGHTEKMKIARRQMSEVVSVEQLQAAEWWPGDTALIEYAYGSDSPRSPQRLKINSDSK